MADPEVVARAMRAMRLAAGQTFKTDDEEEMAVALYANAVQNYTDDAVRAAANEWIRTSKWFPKLVEFADLTRRWHRMLDGTATADDARALPAGGMRPVTEAALGKPGSERVAAQVVLQRMMRAMARTSPQGYFGRAWGYGGPTGPGLRESGHDFGDDGTHAADCERCKLLAAVAFEEAVDFPGSRVTDEMWFGHAPDGRLRRCRDCDNGWVTESVMENDRIVARVRACRSCDGPQPSGRAR